MRLIFDRNQSLAAGRIHSREILFYKHFYTLFFLHEKCIVQPNFYKFYTVFLINVLLKICKKVKKKTV